MKKPIIGVTPLYDTEKDSVYMLPQYLNSITAAGGIPVILPLNSDADDIKAVAECCDGFLFTGGQDIIPAIYGEETTRFCGEVCPARDAVDIAILGEALEADKPIFGICRGLHLVNAVMGGTLYQDLEVQQANSLNIAHNQHYSFKIPVHSVNISNAGPLYDILGTDSIMVNSIHHQGIKVLADSLTPAALSPDSLVEAAYMENMKFVLCVQWHPEYTFETDESSRKLFEAFINACKTE